MKLLVAEDEPKTGAYLQQGLTEAGFTVDRVMTGTDALQHALSEAYDLLILDVMMPGLDGWEVLRMVRAAGKDVPVLFLTARDGVEDRVKGLELGADDYLIKPFAFSELLARVRTLLRRGIHQTLQLVLLRLHRAGGRGLGQRFGSGHIGITQRNQRGFPSHATQEIQQRRIGC